MGAAKTMFAAEVCMEDLNTSHLHQTWLSQDRYAYYLPSNNNGLTPLPAQTSDFLKKSDVYVFAINRKQGREIENIEIIEKIKLFTLKYLILLY